MQFKQRRIITSHAIVQIPKRFPENWSLGLLKDDVPKAAVAFKSFLAAFGTRDSLG